MALVYKTYADPSTTYTELKGIAVDTSGYIYTCGSKSGGGDMTGAWTYVPMTNTLSMITYNQTVSDGWGQNCSANHHGCVVGYYSNQQGIAVFTFNGTTLTRKAMSNVGIGSPYLDIGVSFRGGVESDDILVGQNEAAKILPYTWDGDTTLTPYSGADLYAASWFGSFASANDTYGVVSGYYSVCAYFTFDINGKTDVNTFDSGVDRGCVYISPYSNRCYTNYDGTTIKVYDLASSATLVTTLTPDYGTGGNHKLSLFEDENNVFYTCGSGGVTAWTQDGTTFTESSTYELENCVTMSGDADGYLYVVTSNNRVHVLQNQTKKLYNAVIPYQYY